MTLRHIPTPAGRFTRCDNCDCEPRHSVRNGRTLRETMDFTVPTTRHQLDCACGRSTGLHATLASAEQAWGDRYSQRTLALPAPVASIARRRHARKEVLHG